MIAFYNDYLLLDIDVEIGQEILMIHHKNPFYSIKLSKIFALCCISAKDDYSSGK